MLETQQTYFTVNEVARKMSVHPITVYRWIGDDKLEAHRLPGGRSIRIPSEAVEQLLTTNEEKN